MNFANMRRATFLSSRRVTENVYVNGLPPQWHVYKVNMPQATPFTVWLAHVVRTDVRQDHMQPGYEYQEMPRLNNLHAPRYYEIEYWCTTTSKAQPDPRYRTRSGRVVWVRHQTVAQLRKPRLP
jgi:hypothetical protein